MTPADLADLLRDTAAAVLDEHGLDTAALPDTVAVERPRNPEHGDYATNLALQVAKKVGANPRELADWLATALAGAEGIASAEVAGPGFVNLRIETAAQGAIVADILRAAGGWRGASRLATVCRLRPSVGPTVSTPVKAVFRPSQRRAGGLAAPAAEAIFRNPPS